MTRHLLSVAASVSLLASVATAQWSESFDTYSAGSQVVGQGGWEEWSTGSGALVSNAQSHTPSNSIAIGAATDLVHQYSGMTSGKWVYRALQYIPSTLVGSTYFIMLNTYSYPAGPYSWSVQVEFSVANGVSGDFGAPVRGAARVPLVTDAWVPIQVLIDLDQNWVQFYYNGVLLDDPAVADHPALGGGYSWTGTVFGGAAGASNIAAVDLYANNATDVYYDDISLSQADFEILGTGCSGTMPAPNLSVILPAVAGQTYLEQINNLPLSGCVHIFGFGNQTSLLGPLPLDLNAFGAPGCKLRVNPDSSMFLLGGQNVANFVLDIPLGLQGLKFYVQAAGLDPSANALGLTVSPMAAVWIQ